MECEQPLRWRVERHSDTWTYVPWHQRTVWGEALVAEWGREGCEPRRRVWWDGDLARIERGVGGRWGADDDGISQRTSDLHRSQVVAVTCLDAVGEGGAPIGTVGAVFEQGQT